MRPHRLHHRVKPADAKTPGARRRFWELIQTRHHAFRQEPDLLAALLRHSRHHQVLSERRCRLRHQHHSQRGVAWRRVVFRWPKYALPSPPPALLVAIERPHLAHRKRLLCEQPVYEHKGT